MTGQAEGSTAFDVPVVTVSEAAELLGISRSSVHDMIARGRLEVAWSESGGPKGRLWLSRAVVERVAAERAARRARA